MESEEEFGKTMTFVSSLYGVLSISENHSRPAQIRVWQQKQVAVVKMGVTASWPRNGLERRKNDMHLQHMHPCDDSVHTQQIN